MPDVDSSAIRKIDWHAGVLSVWFHTGGRHDYLAVPESVYRAFLNSSSKGAFFNDQIRDRYAFRQPGPKGRGH